MSFSTRLAVWLVLAIHLAGASLPCSIAQLPSDVRDHAALAQSSADPCPMHAGGDDAPSTWLDELCPCGCGSGVAPGSGASRTGPALLVAPLAAGIASEREFAIHPARHAAGLALAPPDHVPLAIA